MTNEDDVRGSSPRRTRAYGSVDVAFNNAGISPPEDDSILTPDLEAWRRVQEVNLTSVYLCCEPRCLHAGPGQRLDHQHRVLRRGARRGDVQISYTASKGGVLSLSRELGVQFARRRTRQRALPGAGEHPLLTELFAADPERAARRLVHIPMGRFAEPEEIANAVLFLASDESSFITAARSWSTVGSAAPMSPQHEKPCRHDGDEGSGTARPVIGLEHLPRAGGVDGWEDAGRPAAPVYTRSVEAAGAIVVLLPPQVDGAADDRPAGRADHHRRAGCRSGALRPERGPRTVRVAAGSGRVGARAARCGGCRRLPTLGICRGMQLMAVRAGGALEQHLPDVVGHDEHAPDSSSYGWTAIRTGAELPGPPSWWETTCGRLSPPPGGVTHPGFKLTARAADGTIEAMEDPERPFWLGVQWHPESGDDHGLFLGLVGPPRASRSALRYRPCGPFRVRESAVRGRSTGRRAGSSAAKVRTGPGAYPGSRSGTVTRPSRRPRPSRDRARRARRRTSGRQSDGRSRGTGLVLHGVDRLHLPSSLERASSCRSSVSPATPTAEQPYAAGDVTAASERTAAPITSAASRALVRVRERVGGEVGQPDLDRHRPFESPPTSRVATCRAASQQPRAAPRVATWSRRCPRRRSTWSPVRLDGPVVRAYQLDQPRACPTARSSGRARHSAYVCRSATVRMPIRSRLPWSPARLREPRRPASGRAALPRPGSTTTGRRLGRLGGHLGHELRRRHAHRGGQPARGRRDLPFLSSLTPGADPLAGKSSGRGAAADRRTPRPGSAARPAATSSRSSVVTWSLAAR